MSKKAGSRHSGNCIFEIMARSSLDGSYGFLFGLLVLVCNFKNLGGCIVMKDPLFKDYTQVDVETRKAVWAAIIFAISNKSIRGIRHGCRCVDCLVLSDEVKTYALSGDWRKDV